MSYLLEGRFEIRFSDLNTKGAPKVFLMQIDEEGRPSGPKTIYWTTLAVGERMAGRGYLRGVRKGLDRKIFDNVAEDCRVSKDYLYDQLESGCTWVPEGTKVPEVGFILDMKDI